MGTMAWAQKYHRQGLGMIWINGWLLTPVIVHPRCALRPLAVGNASLFLHHLTFHSVPFIYLDGDAMLFWLLWLCNKPWNQILLGPSTVFFHHNIIWAIVGPLNVNFTPTPKASWHFDFIASVILICGELTLQQQWVFWLTNMAYLSNVVAGPALVLLF